MWGVSTVALLAATMGAGAQQAAQVQTLDAITVVATKTEERAIDALAPVSVVSQQDIERKQPSRVGDLLKVLPGVNLMDRGDEPSTAVNIRGLQDFGRVAVVVDGARQNYQRTGHNANGSFFLDPELIGGIDVVRGPAANIYGSGAIGGVAAFRTKDIDDVVRAGERWGVDVSGLVGSNRLSGMGSVFGGVRVDPTVDVFGGAVYRSSSNYKDGSGTEVGNSGSDLAAGLLKLTTRPAEGHTVKFGGTFQEFDYSIGQPNRGPTTTAAPAAAIAGTSVYDTRLRNYTGTVNWRYTRPDDDLFDWNINLYGNRTESNQVKTYNNRITSGGGVCSTANPGNNITGCVGDGRSYLLDTFGIDANNTSRFTTGDWRHAVTLGVDAFRDDVTTRDSRGNSNVTTPGGQRTVSGGFVQLKSNYASWLEVIGAARYDHYELSSLTTSSSGDRVSPKITVGVTPLAGVTPYVSYAEGYRAPSITETLIAGGHATGGGPVLFTCDDGTSGLFCFRQNPNLRPEVGRNKEAGLNLKRDGLFAAGDQFRAKVNVFRNDIADYIDLVASTPEVSNLGPGFGTYSKYYQYQNIAAARIEGIEAEAVYDAGNWFTSVAGNLLRGKNVETGVGLATLTQPKKIATTVGVRFLDRRLTVSAQYVSFAANTDVPKGYLAATSGDLVNLYVTWQPTTDITLNFSVDNVGNRYYRPYAIPGSSTDGTTQNDVLFSSPGPGVTWKGGLKVHFGGA
jgi:hemoglobin/transferrin/lactoferrin receptor protein